MSESDRNIIFISCGQRTDEEKRLGQAIFGLVRELTPLTPFFAAEVPIILVKTTYPDVSERRSCPDVVVTNPGPQSATLVQSFFYAPPSSGSQFFTLTPCRVLDTRNPTGPLGWPPLQPGATRTFDVTASACGIPADAVAISVNLAVTNVGAPGELVVFPSDVSRPNTSALSFRAGRTRANNSIVSLSRSSPTFSVFNNSAATVDFILDVNGFFR